MWQAPQCRGRLGQAPYTQRGRSIDPQLTQCCTLEVKLLWVRMMLVGSMDLVGSVVLAKCDLTTQATLTSDLPSGVYHASNLNFRSALRNIPTLTSDLPFGVYHESKSNFRSALRIYHSTNLNFRSALQIFRYANAGTDLQIC